MTTSTLTIARRFRGPNRSGNGGYTAGLLAAELTGAELTGAELIGAELTGAEAVSVTLRQPPPLDVALRIKPDGATAQLAQDGTVLAVAQPGKLTIAPAEPVPYEVAIEASRGYLGFLAHPFPGCFVCGPDRAGGDGLRLFPGPVPGRADTVATPWVPGDGLADQTAAVPPAIVWAALDCPGGWSVDLIARPMVLGRMTARVDAVPAVGERCVVVGHARGQDGRKAFTDSALYDSSGALLAQAEATWIAVDPAVINALA